MTKSMIGKKEAKFDRNAYHLQRQAQNWHNQQENGSLLALHI